MDPIADVASRPHSGYRHEAFFFADDEEFLAAAAPFVRAGTTGGEPTLVALEPARLDLVRDALGPDANGAVFADMTEVGANPGRILPALQAFLHQVGVDRDSGSQSPVRCLGEPIWPGRRPAEIVECQLNEALLNMAIEPDAPVWLRCSYDLGSLPAEVTETARRSHPLLVDVVDYRGSTTYEGLHHVQTLLGSALPAPDGPVRELRFAGDGLRPLRELVRGAAAAANVPDTRIADLELAVHEVARNSLVHGGGGGLLRVWATPGALMCEVTDSGRIEDPLVGRSAPSIEADKGRGLWLAQHLVDLVQLRTSAQGTTVRLSIWR